MRDYGRVHCQFWSSETIKPLPDDAKQLALYLLTCPHGNMVGAFRLPLAYAVDDLGWVSERLSNGFKTLVESGFISRCERTGWTWVRKHLEWNKPDNPNQWKSVRKLVDLIPDSVAFAAEIKSELGTVSEPSNNLTVTDTASSKEKEPEKKPKDDPCPHDEIVALFREILPDNIQVRAWTDQRRKNLRARWLEDEKRQTAAYWRRLFEFMAESDFLTGRKPGHDGRYFKPGLDWVVLPENFAKIIEKRYHQ